MYKGKLKSALEAGATDDSSGNKIISFYNTNDFLNWLYRI